MVDCAQPVFRLCIVLSRGAGTPSAFQQLRDAVEGLPGEVLEEDPTHELRGIRIESRSSSRSASGRLGQLRLDRVREALQSLERAARLADKFDAETALQVRLALARALWQSGADRARAVALAEGVRRDADAHGDREAQAWLSVARQRR
jgi:hypothetical protein